MSVSAPSPSGEATPAGQADDQQVQGGQAAGGVDAPGSAPGEVAAPEPKPRQRKERLPGVVSRDDGEDIFPDLGFKSNKRNARIGREEAEQEAADELREEMGLPPSPNRKPDAEGEQEPEAPKTPAKIKFNGKEYDSMAAIEQEHKSLQGMFKPMQARLEASERTTREAIARANEWMEYAKRQSTPQAQPQPQQQQSQPSDEQSAQQELERVMAGIDGNRFESLAREHGLPLAGRYLAAQVLATVHDQMLPALAERIMAQMQDRFAPVAQSVEQQQQTAQAGTLIENVSQFRSNDGQLAFPELNDPDEMMQVAELWSTNPHAELTPQSLIQAIAMYRLYRGARNMGQTPNTPTVNVTPPPNIVAKPTSLENGGVAASPTAPRNVGRDEDGRFARALDDAALVDRTLGFAVRRRR